MLTYDFNNRPFDSPFAAAPSVPEFDKSKGDFIFRGQGISPYEMLRSVPARSTAQSLTQAVKSQQAGYNTSKINTVTREHFSTGLVLSRQLGFQQGTKLQA
jgi:hypothetical protein